MQLAALCVRGPVCLSVVSKNTSAVVPVSSVAPNQWKLSNKSSLAATVCVKCAADKGLCRVDESVSSLTLARRAVSAAK